MKVSCELLYHFQCDACCRWWSIGDFEYKPTEIIYCPHCKNPGKLPDNPLLAEDFQAQSPPIAHPTENESAP